MENGTRPKKKGHARKEPKLKERVKHVPIVGVGASAGGLDAALRLFKSLPPRIDFAFVVIQHLDPNYPSQIASILSRHSEIPVEAIENRTSVEANHIYVIPPNAIVKLEQGRLILTPRNKGPRLNTIDLFFESLARAKKAEAIGIILSGTGSDGASGLMAIKSAGGMTFAQDPSSAKYDGMPQHAIQSGAANFVLPPEGISEKLVQVANRNRSSQTSGSNPPGTEPLEETGETLQRIFNLLQINSHIDFSKYKPSTVGRRIQRQMRLHKQEDVKSYLKYLQQTPGAVKELSEQMFINVTEFFRDPESFLELTEKVFPRLTKGRVAGVPIRIWIPGCSTGEEPYSIVIALMEFLGSKAATTQIQIFATDISEAAVKQARSGLYAENQVEGLSPERLKRFFDKTKDGYRVKKAIRDHCVFSRHDVTSSPPFAKIDLLSCRNLLIYFAPELQKQVMPVFHYALNPDGFLWLGKSEAPTGFSKLFTLIDKTHKIYSKNSLSSPLNFKFPSSRPLVESAAPLKRAPNHFAASIDSQKEFDRIVISRYAPAGVMINSDLEIIQVRGHTGPFMELPSGQPSHNLFKMVKRELLPGIRMAVQAAMKQNKSIRKEALSFELGAERRKVNIEVIPVNGGASAEERQYLVLFEDGIESKKKGRSAKKEAMKAGAGKSHGDTKEAYIRQLLDEIDSTREYQQTLAEGYEASQEELTSANEELQSANEELQSTNEEMETAKEELQAANEELTTVNEELQTRNSELVILNEQLALSEERFRLLVTGVKDYAIFLLDPEGHVASWNEGARRFKGYEANEIIGKHFSIFYPKAAIDARYPDHELKIATAEGRYEDEGWRIRKDGSRFWANVVITRISDRNGNLVGFSKITRDLTERKQSEERFRLLIEGIKDYAIFRIDPAGNVATWNEGARRLMGYSADQIIGKSFATFYPEDAIANGLPTYELKMATSTGRHEDEGWRVRKDGSRYWANTTITRMDDENGELVGFSKITRDLSERKKMEDALRRSRDELEVRVKQRTEELSSALNARDEFLSIASHELKTPLTGLKLQFQMERRSLDASPEQVPSRQELIESYELASRQIDSLADLVEDLLDTSRIQTGNFTLTRENLDLSILVNEVVTRFSEQLKVAGCAVDLNLAPSVEGYWDRHRLEQVVVNLISNAIKYAPKGAIYISTAKLGDTASLCVQDSGPGVPKDLQTKIFERFERAKANKNVGGLGLGLFIVRKIVDAHQGQIYVEGDEGRGAKFVVDLPLKPSEEKPGAV